LMIQSRFCSVAIHLKVDDTGISRGGTLGGDTPMQ
jgi:hypothetical protein